MMEAQFAWTVHAPVARITQMNASSKSYCNLRSALIIHKLQFNTTREKLKIQSRFQGFLRVLTTPEELKLQM